MMNRFIDHLITPLATSRNYSAIANLHSLKTNTAPAKLLPAFCVLTDRSLETASNSGHFSASHAHVFRWPTLIQILLSAILLTELVRHVFSAFLAELNMHTALTIWIPGWRPFQSNRLVLSS
jgi:hypothetical protein